VRRDVGFGVLLVALAFAAGWWWRQTHRSPPVPAPAPAAGPPVPAPAPPPSEPAIKHPVPAGQSGALPEAGEADRAVKNALVELVGRKAGASFLRLEDAVHRLVATVNNLASDQATAELWPVTPTPGRFETERRDGATVIAASNAARYAPFVRFADGIDTKKAVALYFRLYPIFQRAYEDLGYPGKYLNDRVVEVVDNLVATPKVAGPIRVRRVGADAAVGPGLYLYEDPALESASAGQKILLRMGAENAATLTAKLAEIRAQIAGGAPGGRK
jgi:Protein of unknown function (DUF3014)